MAASVRRTGNPLRDPPWTFQDLWSSAALWSLLGPGFAAFLIVLHSVLGYSDPSLSWTSWLFRWVWLSLAVSGGIFLGYLLYWSRSVRAGLFAVVTASVTLVSLAVLVWFLVSLVQDGWAWLQFVEKSVQENNAALLKRWQQFEQERQAELSRFEQAAAQTRQQVEEQIAQLLQEANSPEERALAQRQAAELRRRSEERLQRLRQRLEKNLSRLQEEVEREYRSQFQPQTGAVAALRRFLTSPSSDNPSRTGVLPALVGSFYMALITLVVAVPIGVGAALYLEEYARRTWFARLIEINLANLAGVPSVVYGILGAFVFVELLFAPIVDERGTFTVSWLQQLTEWLFGREVQVAHRNTLGGGLTLAMLTLPVIIVTAQEALRAVPVSLRHSALALGATRWQMIAHHVLPYAFPNILTGVILAISRVLGEAAPLVLFGALLFLDYTPHLFSRFTVTPMQIYNWASRPQVEWRYCAAMASLVLIAMLLTLNAAAIFLRHRGQRRYRW